MKVHIAEINSKKINCELIIKAIEELGGLVTSVYAAKEVRYVKYLHAENLSGSMMSKYYELYFTLGGPVKTHLKVISNTRNKTRKGRRY